MTKNSNCYSWLPFFEELLNRICSEYNSESLYTIWNQFFPEKYEDIGQIDPFSFIGKFNSLGDSNYKKYCEKLKEIFKLKSDVPTDFNGIPRTNRTNPVFFNEYWKHFKNNKETIPMDKIMENLWKLANSLNNGEINKEFFSTVLSYQSVGLSKLTQLFFLCKPHKYYSYDSVNRAYLKKLNGGVTENSIEGFYKFQELAEKCKKESYIFSHEAWQERENLPDFEDLQKNLYDKEKINENQKTNGTTEIANSKYIVNYINIIIQHKHNALEKSFKNYLLSKNINEKNIKQNSHFVDFIFTHRNKKYICELKPSKKEEIKYAIRNSLGQIIEYDYKDNGQYDYKVIVFQKTPTKEILKYLEHIKNKYGIYYLTEVEKNRFEGNLNL